MMSRTEIVDVLNNNLSLSQIDKDYFELKAYSKKDNINGSVLNGCKVVNHFTLDERLNTVGNKGISFYDFFYNFDVYKDKAYVSNLMAYYIKQNRYNNEDVKLRKCIYNLYFGSIIQFYLLC